MGLAFGPGSRGGEGGRGAVEVGEGGCQGARQGRAPLLPIESRNEEVMLPLTLEIQMRAMARTLLRGEGACRQRISPAQRRDAVRAAQPGRNASGT